MRIVIFVEEQKKLKDDRETTICIRKYNYFDVDNPELIEDKENDDKSSIFGSDYYELYSQGYSNGGFENSSF